MKFLIDAQLPPSLCRIFTEQDYDAIHTQSLPAQNDTPDREIIRVSMQSERTVITKDSDFWESYVLKKEPYKLVLVKTGNISTKNLKALFSKHVTSLVAALQENEVVVISQESLKLPQ